jgi:hypothetical protein
LTAVVRYDVAVVARPGKAFIAAVLQQWLAFFIYLWAFEKVGLVVHRHTFIIV